MQLPRAPTGWLRVETVGPGRPTLQARIAEIEVPGVSVDKALVLPDAPAAWGDPRRDPAEAALDARRAAWTSTCRCAAWRAATSPARRTAASSRALDAARRTRTTSRELWVRPARGTAVEEALLRDLPVSVTSSSQGVPDARASGLAALDGNRGTDVDGRAERLAPHPDGRAGSAAPRSSGLTLTRRAPTRRLARRGGSC